MDILARSRRSGDRTLPRRLHAGFGTGRTNGFQAGKRFNENAVTRRGFRLQSLHRAIERTLQDKPNHDHDRQHDKRNPRQRSRDNKENPDKEHGKNQIGCRHHAAGSEELAYRIEVAELIGNDADRSSAAAPSLPPSRVRRYLRQERRLRSFRSRRSCGFAPCEAQSRTTMARPIPIDSAISEGMAPFGTTRS